MSYDTTGNSWAMQKFIDAKHFGLKNRFDHLQKAEIVGVTFTEVEMILRGYQRWAETYDEDGPLPTLPVEDRPLLPPLLGFIHGHYDGVPFSRRLCVDFHSIYFPCQTDVKKIRRFIEGLGYVEVHKQRVRTQCVTKEKGPTYVNIKYCLPPWQLGLRRDFDPPGFLPGRPHEWWNALPAPPPNDALQREGESNAVGAPYERVSSATTSEEVTEAAQTFARPAPLEEAWLPYDEERE